MAFQTKAQGILRQERRGRSGGCLLPWGVSLPGQSVVITSQGSDLGESAGRAGRVVSGGQGTYTQEK